MNYFLAGILRIVILEASAALLLVDHLFRPRRVREAYGVIAVLALVAFFNFGQFRGRGHLVHDWEQFHFYLGSKYLPEIGYFDIYKATLVADRESAGVLRHVREIRDLHDFEVVPVDRALTADETERVRARFTDERWAEFKADWATLSRRAVAWRLVLTDHGNSASPAWAIFARPIATLLPPVPWGQIALALLDPLLMMVLFTFIFLTFGARTGCIALTLWSLVPFCFDYLFGSFLRWDWLFAVGMSLCFFRRGRPFTSGAFLGYAVASKLFPVFFGVALLGKAAIDALRNRRIGRGPARFFAGCGSALAVSVLLSSAVVGRPSIWLEYKARIDVARHERFYSNQYSLRTLYLQAVASDPRTFLSSLLVPREIQQGRGDVDLADHRLGFAVVQIALTGILFAAMIGVDEFTALAMGPFLVFIWLVVNAYYWNMLALPALAWADRWGRQKERVDPARRTRNASIVALVGLHLALGAFYFYQHLNRGYAEGYFVALMLLCLLLLWAGLEISERGRGRKIPDEQDAQGL